MKSDSSTWIERLAVPAFFALHLLIGLWIAPDYGVSFDEPIQRRHGIVSADYIRETLGLPGPDLEEEFDLPTYEHRHYGVAFQLVCFAFEKILGAETFREWHLLQHYLVFLLFWAAGIVFYRLLRRRWNDPRIALAGVALLVLMPRIFAHSFYNVKDLVLLSAVIFVLGAAARFFEKKSTGNAVLLGLTVAFAINVRIVAVFLPVLIAGWALITLRKKDILPLLVCGVTAAVTTIAIWPYLWTDPIGHFLESYRVMGKYPWGGEVLLMGNFYYPAGGLPWFYLPVWIGLTLPIPYTLLFLAGLSRPRRAIDFFMLAFLAFPVAMVLIKKSVLYDDWRQLYFLYPGMVWFMAAALAWLSEKWKGTWAVLGGILAAVIGQMAYLHPHQQTYLNVLAGSHRTSRYDMDYWGVAYKQAFEYILAHDTASVIPYYPQNYPGYANHAFLPEDQRKRFQEVYGDGAGAKYYLTNFRERREQKRFRNWIYPFEKEFGSVRAGKYKIIGIYHLDERPPNPK